MVIVVLGGGVIGCSIAYYLAKSNISCIIIEDNEIASAASGKAGGFLAKTWCDSGPMKDLANLSFDLLKDIANSAENNTCDFRFVDVKSIFVDRESNQSLPFTEVPWIDAKVVQYSSLGSSADCAQIHPFKLCHFMLAEAVRMTEGRTRVVIDEAVGFHIEDNESVCKIKGVKLRSGDPIMADKFVVAMGPWSDKVEGWLPPDVNFPRIMGSRAHSVVLNVPQESKNAINNSCIFLQYCSSQGVISPEIYPRPDGTVYICGMGDATPLPDTSREVEVESWRCERLTGIATDIASCLRPGNVKSQQSCYLPVACDGVPVIGSIQDCEGLWIAAGHSCWGILNAPATGLIVANMLQDIANDLLDVSKFNPNRTAVSRFNPN